MNDNVENQPLALTVGTLVDLVMMNQHKRLIIQYDDDKTTMIVVCTICGRRAKLFSTESGPAAKGEALTEQCGNKTTKERK